MSLCPAEEAASKALSETSLSEVLPVIYDTDNLSGLGTQNPASYILTQRGREHWLTKLRGTAKRPKFLDEYSAFIGLQQSIKQSLAQKFLAVHSNYVTEWGKMPILFIRQEGAGKSLYLGTDSAWRWRRGVEDKYHYRF